MRFYLGHRLPLGFYGGVSVPFHPSRVLVHNGSGQPSAGVIYGAFAFGALLGVVLILSRL